ncbi:MAG: hypothetical protein H6831_09405 [Planctomycetes bacterium]|nr:hypothetical protein [Planctomycetota bacterium]MCB9904610.1 hypothetical protein [Planctomycetota bacterium]
MTEAQPVPPQQAPAESNGRGGLKFCLFGALIMFAAVLITIGIIFMEVRSLSTEEGAWGKIAESLEFDERPPGWEVEFGIGYSRIWGYSQIFLVDDVNDLKFSFRLDADPEAAALLLDPESNELQRTVTGSGVVAVQGRELPYIDYEFPGKDDSSYRGRMVGITEAGAERGVLIEFLRALDGPPITDADVQRELAPFHIGPER